MSVTPHRSQGSVHQLMTQFRSRGSAQRLQTSRRSRGSFFFVEECFTIPKDLKASVRCTMVESGSSPQYPYNAGRTLGWGWLADAQVGRRPVSLNTNNPPPPDTPGLWPLMVPTRTGAHFGSSWYRLRRVPQEGVGRSEGTGGRVGLGPRDFGARSGLPAHCQPRQRGLSAIYDKSREIRESSKRHRLIKLFVFLNTNDAENGFLL